MKKVIYFLFTVLVSIVMISCSDITVSSGYIYYPYTYYYHYRIPYRAVYRERIIVVSQHRNTNYDHRKRTFENNRRFDNDNFQFNQRQKNNGGSIGQFGGRRRRL